jgi:protocatechuate 4,5-dioxygenase beta chain
MGKLVTLLGVTHNPFLPRVFRQNPDTSPGIRKTFDNFQLMRQKLHEANPDTLVVVGSDHLNQFFMENMPPFLIGKAAQATGPFDYEKSSYEIPDYRAAVHVEFAKTLVREGFKRNVDFSYSDEFVIDHAFTVPLGLLRSDADIPVVPIFTNVSAPPVPPSQRFYDVGMALRSIIEEMPASDRVAVIASGHMSLDVGGPKTNQTVDPDFDRQMTALISAGKASEVIREATWERMFNAGNQTPGFSNFIMLLGLAMGAPASFAELNQCWRTASPFFHWENL